MSMMPGNPYDADYPYPEPVRKDNENPHNLNYCKFLFGKEVNSMECTRCPYKSCTGQTMNDG